MLLSSRKVLSFLAKHKNAIHGQHAGALAYALAHTVHIRHKLAHSFMKNKHVRELV